MRTTTRTSDEQISTTIYLDDEDLDDTTWMMNELTMTSYARNRLDD